MKQIRGEGSKDWRGEGHTKRERGRGGGRDT